MTQTQQVYGYAWQTEGCSGFELFNTPSARELDLAVRLVDSPEPKPKVSRFSCQESESEWRGNLAIEMLESHD